MALDGLASGIFNALGRLKGRRRLDEEELKDMLKSLRRALQEALRERARDVQGVPQ